MNSKASHCLTSTTCLTFIKTLVCGLVIQFATHFCMADERKQEQEQEQGQGQAQLPVPSQLPPESFRGFEAHHPTWRDETAWVSNVGMRCATVYDFAGRFFLEYAMVDDQRRAANVFYRNTDIFLRVGYFLAVRGNQTDAQLIQEFFSRKTHYIQLKEDSLQNSRNIMLTTFGDDLNFCNENLNFFRSVKKRLESDEVKNEDHSLREASKVMRRSSEEGGPSASASGQLGLGFNQELIRYLDPNRVTQVWAYLLSEMKGPAHLNRPPMVIDPELPTSARFVFEFPSQDAPENPLQIRVSPRTLNEWRGSTLYWGLGHELAHYLFLRSENAWLEKSQYESELHHHCDPEFMTLTRKLADFLEQNSTQALMQMYAEGFRSCMRNPQQ